MGKQINLYLSQADLEKVQKYLLSRRFILFADKILANPMLVMAHTLITNNTEWARFVAFEDTQFDYLTFKKEGKTQYRPTDRKAETMTFSYYDCRENIYRVRFYYCPYYFENHEKKFKNPDFGLHVERFFRWLRRTFVRVPNMPTFYQNPDFPVKEAF